MRVEDALRKIRLLRKVIPENGAFEAEAETATRLAHTLMERHSIRAKTFDPSRLRLSQMTWVYWEQLLAEFDISLDHFGGRASASLVTDARYRYPAHCRPVAYTAYIVKAGKS